MVFFVLIILGPLVMFAPLLDRTQRKGSADYGLRAGRYVFSLEDRWMRDDDPKPSGLLGTPDIQSMADLANVYSNVRQTRLVPFGSKEITNLAITSAVPFLPLALTMFSVPQLMRFLVKIVFR